MSRYSYETFAEMQKANAQAKQKPVHKVGYFKLDDGEEALVRFNCATPADFEIVTTHAIKVKDRFRNVSCLRTKATEPLDNCPLCANGTPTKTRVYIKLIKYIVDEFGKVTGTDSLVANFPKRYADNLNTLIQEYDDLRNQVFKIKRDGSGKETSYTFMYMNPVKYSEANGFVKDFSNFEGFDLVPHSFVERSKEDIEEFLATGDFPIPMKKEVKEELPTHPGIQQDEEEMTAPFKTTGVQEMPKTTSEVTPGTTVTQNVESQSTNRPRRTYDWDN